MENMGSNSQSLMIAGFLMTVYFVGRDPLMGLSFVIWKSQEFLQAPDMID